MKNHKGKLNIYLSIVIVLILTIISNNCIFSEDIYNLPQNTIVIGNRAYDISHLFRTDLNETEKTVITNECNSLKNAQGGVYYSIKGIGSGKWTNIFSGQAFDFQSKAEQDFFNGLYQDGLKYTDNSGKVYSLAKYRVHFKKPDTWGVPEVYYYDDEHNGFTNGPTWNTSPAMISEGNGWYYYDLPVEWATAVTRVIFKDGIHQLPGAMQTGIQVSQETWIYSDGNTTTINPNGPILPAASAEPGTSSFSTDTLTVTLHELGDNVTIAKYTLDGSDPSTNGIDFKDGAQIVIGSDMQVNGTKKLRMYVSNGTNSDNEEFVYTKISKPQVNTNFKNLRIYEVMVDSFQDGDPNVGYGTGYGTSNFKGDLKGITNALEYIKSTGANAIWLTPIFNSDGNSQLDSTGYFAENYFQIDPKFGTMDDAKALVQKAHSLGLYVFFDGVFGHHKDVSIPASPSGYTVQGNSDPVSYPGSLNFYKEVATWWIDQLEIDGWRLDQCYQLSACTQGKNYLTDIREAVEQKCAERKAQGKQWGTLGYIVGEDWEAPQSIQTNTYGTDSNPGLHSAFDFATRYALVQVLATQERTDQNGTYGRPASALNDAMNIHDSSYSSHAMPNLMIDNHDLVRFGDLIQRAPNLGYGKENPDYWKRYKAAFSFLAAYTGPIMMYYGDEIGDEVPGYVTNGQLGAYDDNCGRSNGQISGLDQNQQNLKDYVASLMNLREKNSALWNGTRTNLVANQTQYADLKQDDKNKIVYALNTAIDNTTIVIPVDKAGGTKLVDALTGDTITPEGGNYNINVNGLTGRFLNVIE